MARETQTVTEPAKPAAAGKPAATGKPLERALEEAVARALRDNLAPLQRTADELHEAFSDLVAACGSARPSNALPAMLRAQTAAAALQAGLNVLSNFVAVALNPRESGGAEEPASEAAPAHRGGTAAAGTARIPEAAAPSRAASQDAEDDWADTPEISPVEIPVEAEEELAPAEPVAEPVAAHFEVASLPPELQDLHRRANRVAKVAMQDIKMLRPNDVRLGREHKDICARLRGDLDKARKEYDRRFRAILEQPVDYFRQWMVEILAEGIPEALGEYPYPSPVAR